MVIKSTTGINMKKILITGASGMVGKNLTENPVISKYHLLTPSSSELNLLDYQSVKKYLNANTPEVIIHCAGRVGGIQANIKNPVAFLVENWEMGKNVVMAARSIGITQLINMGSSCMYPKNSISPLTENLILNGVLESTNEGYALSKISVAKLCEYIMREDPHLHYKTLVPCNLYGRWDKFNPEYSHMVPAVIRKIHEAKKNNHKSIEIWGDGSAKREFMFAADLADFISYILPKIKDIPSIMNVGLGEDFTVNEYYKIIAEVIGFDGEFNHNLSKPVGMKRKMVSISQQNQIGWKPKYNLINGIEETYKFYLEHFE